MTREEEGIIRGVIHDAPLALLLDELRARGHVVCLDAACQLTPVLVRRAACCFPGTYPPEVVPFDGERQGKVS